MNFLPWLRRSVFSDMLNSFKVTETFFKLGVLWADKFIASYSAECPLMKPVRDQIS